MEVFIIPEMGKIGCGYGSEWHLLRYLGYHRQELNDEILSKTGGEKIHWLDFKFSKSDEPLMADRELKGVEFLNSHVNEFWRNYWPQRGNVHNWDAVGQLFIDGKREWLLVEAKAHVGELKRKCGASSPNSIKKISDAMEGAMKSFDVKDVVVDKWLSPYYQFCNRLTMLHFLN